MLKNIAAHPFITYLSSPALLHYTLPFVMIYLIGGTVAQKYIGLYEATRIFFSAPVIWLGPVPLPGFPLVLAVMFINLACKLIFKSPWTLRNAGIIVSHIAVMVLLLGGLLTALFSREGYVDLMPGDSKAYVTDYHARSFVIRDEDGQTAAQWDHQGLQIGQVLDVPSLPFTVRILETCRHCEITARTIAEGDSNAYQGMAKQMTLQAAPLQLEDESNMGGMTFAVNDRQGQQIGVYTAIEEIPNWPVIDLGGKSYRLILHKEKRSLPFSIDLLEFKRDAHPGTQMAKAYESRVRISDQGSAWESVIRMNEPLRYKGYTLFQSSFIQSDRGDVSVLAVVLNTGRTFPYLAGLILALGLILHLFVRKRAKP